MTILIAIAVALIIYCALLYVAPGPDKTTAEPALATSGPKVFRNLTLGVLSFLLLDGVIFHSGLYQSVLEPQSNAGRVMALMRQEKERKPSGHKEILVLGDSRMGVGFSEELANSIAAARDITFINRSMPGSVPQLWYYLLREIDPSARRYAAIIVPLKIDPSDTPSALVNISQTAPLLRYTDAYAFASSFDGWSNRCRAFMACLFRGTAFQADLFDLLAHPLTRIRHLQQPPAIGMRKNPMRQAKDVVGIEFDPVTHRMKLPEHLSRHQRNSLRRAAKMLRSEYCSGSCFDWTERILGRYDSSATSVVVVQLPKGPLSVAFEDTRARDKSGDLRNHKVIMFEQERFASLEQPAYYVDGFHFNRKGQEQFTRGLTEDLLVRLASPDPAQVRASQRTPLIDP